MATPLQARAPHSPVIIVGTHLDKLPAQKSRDLKEHYKQKIVQLYRKPGYPNIESIRMVSCTNQEGLRELVDRIYYAAVSAIDHDTKEHVIGMQVGVAGIVGVAWLAMWVLCCRCHPATLLYRGKWRRKCKAIGTGRFLQCSIKRSSMLWRNPLSAMTSLIQRSSL